MDVHIFLTLIVTGHGGARNFLNMNKSWTKSKSS